MIILIVILVIFFGVLLVVGVNSRIIREFFKYKGVETKDLSDIELEFLKILNSHRESIGLPILIAEKLASEICFKQNLEDIKLGVPSSHEHWDRMRREAKVNVDNCGHVYGNNHVSAQGLFDSFMASPFGHKEQLEHKTRTHIGISFYQRRSHILITKY